MRPATPGSRSKTIRRNRRNRRAGEVARELVLGPYARGDGLMLFIPAERVGPRKTPPMPDTLTPGRPGRSRLTVGRLMIIVAVAGLGLSGGGVFLARREYRRLAESHDHAAKVVWLEALHLEERAFFGPAEVGARLKDQALRLEAIAAHHASLSSKYEGAAGSPWLPVEPDPPPPN